VIVRLVSGPTYHDQILHERLRSSQARFEAELAAEEARLVAERERLDAEAELFRRLQSDSRIENLILEEADWLQEAQVHTTLGAAAPESDVVRRITAANRELVKAVVEEFRRSYSSR